MMRRLVTLVAVAAIPPVCFAQTAGCGTSPPTDPGAWVDSTLEKVQGVAVDGLDYRIWVPSGYDSSTPMPLVALFHGWGCRYSHPWLRAFGQYASQDATPQMIVVSLNGIADNKWRSWNGFGSTASPGPDGEICSVNKPSYLYDSCDATAAAQQENQCWWTTCRDSINETLAILARVEALMCVNTSAIFGMGCSNGAMFQYELADNPLTSAKFAAHVPVLGAPHNGA